MSASTSEHSNFFNKNDLAKITKKDFFLFGKKGVVINIYETLVELKLKDGIVLITHFKNLKKLRRKDVRKVTK